MSKPSFVLVLGLLVASSAQADLVFHQGFETCWSSALTKADFLARLRNQVDGRTACLPPQSGNQSGIAYTICNTPDGCGSGVPGCAVTVQSQDFAGDFIAGQFSAPGTASDIAVPLTTSLFGNCTINITGVTLTTTVDYLMRLDGIDGVHVEDMQTPLVDITNYSTSNNCNPVVGALIASYIPQAVTSAEENAAAAIEPGLRADTVGQSVCPLTP
ncbi:MAG TPA: hypothetical protein PKO41_07585 [Dokdonella sp.]|uniref:hypothetical protein n=1 Tax=Dokdonella sp. TaxID=2291710 RepID=UPI0025BAB934|nr:hypothetical protein [Dokdonella sp.]MBX3691852.1 hypothetical protein [Dokdonella sp.]MCW5568097.1 hypothetical protein [Dokdonella sp.]HNR92270.1 hypothetical protein [Dokdonella sp.]